ncbi:MAG: GvpL/GvpF family gas vesicle protein [bacterium]
MAKTGKYIYGIINSNTTLHLSVPKDFPGSEGSSNGVYTIPHHDISAMVKDCEIFDYTSVPDDIGVRMLLKHQAVIERIMNSGIAVIPVQLGTFIEDEIEVKRVLDKGYNLIKEILDKINDKIEIDVAVTWHDFSSFIKEIGEESEIREFKDRLLAHSTEIATDDRIIIGKMLSKILEERREKYSSRIHYFLDKISAGIKAHDVMDDKMVLNSAFLINKKNLENFEKEIELLNTAFDNKLNFKCIGPLPPYSFYTLEIKKLLFEKIDWARKKLRLIDSSVTRDEIKKAYQALVVTFHPDNNPDIPGIETQFEDITNAHEILKEYCQAGQYGACSFIEEEFNKNALLVRVKV